MQGTVLGTQTQRALTIRLIANEVEHHASRAHKTKTRQRCRCAQHTKIGRMPWRIYMWPQRVLAKWRAGFAALDDQVRKEWQQCLPILRDEVADRFWPG